MKLEVGLGFGFVYVGSVLTVDRMVDRQWRATGQALAKATSFGLAPIIGAFLGGLVYQRVGPQALFLGSAFLALGAGGIHALFTRRLEERQAVREAI